MMGMAYDEFLQKTGHGSLTDMKAEQATRRKEMVEFFCRHLVGISVRYKHKTPEDEGDRPRFSASSGTLIIIERVMCFLTAGHVLQALDELRSSEKVEIMSAALVDTLGAKRISNIPIPFDLKNAGLYYIVDDEAGLDFGVIALEPHYVRLLVKNGVVALTEANWASQHTVNFDAYAMLGLPTEFTSERVSPSGSGQIAPTMFGVTKLPAPPERRRTTTYPLFVGQLDPALELKSVEGMSGGPIFGFQLGPDGNYRYWIVALQSSWERDTRIVYGCSVPVFASLMTKWANEQTPASSDDKEGAEPT